jgi:uncharacterized protein YdeI (YjbR/CyaY-like superfamily)
MDNKSLTTLFSPTQSHLRKWFERNHNKTAELWIGYYKKSTGKPSITWQESVDEALCFGWIDGIRKSIDEESYKIRFTPRRKDSIWSEVNTKRMLELIKLGLAKPAGLEAFKKKDEKKTNRYSFEQRNVKFPKEFEKKIKANKKAWDYFQKLPPSARRLSMWWIIDAKKEETKLRRLDTLIQCSEEGRKIPPLIISKKDKQG